MLFVKFNFGIEGKESILSVNTQIKNSLYSGAFLLN